jgi:hypothetical protein
VVGGIVDGWYEIRVEDNGDGIPEELRQRLFQRYLHEGDMPIILGSVGLGLSIVRALAEGMGGAVWYDRHDDWTSFVVRVPLATDAEASKYREPGARNSGRADAPVGMPPDPAPTQPPSVIPEDQAPAIPTPPAIPQI